jgi:hypothetical protein
MVFTREIIKISCNYLELTKIPLYAGILISTSRRNIALKHAMYIDTGFEEEVTPAM